MTDKIHNDIEDTKKILENNLHKIMLNMEELEVIENKSEDLKKLSKGFKRNASQVKRNICLKNLKLTICISVFILIIVSLIIAILVKIFYIDKQYQ
ncbi:MAG: hypothetical protein QW478_00380 [Candidatus Micrarchaeaceae archaeon]